MGCYNHELCINDNLVERTHNLTDNWCGWDLQAIFYSDVDCAESGRAEGFKGRVAMGILTEGTQEKGLQILWSLFLSMSFLSLICDLKWDGKSVNSLAKAILISDWGIRKLLSSPLKLGGGTPQCQPFRVWLWSCWHKQWKTDLLHRNGYGEYRKI